MRFKYLAGIVCACVHFNSQSETQISAGLGYQHGGVLGVQVGYIKGRNKYFAALGLVGGALGYQRALDEYKQHMLGIAFGSEQLTSEDGFAILTYNYHLSGLQNEGWHIGVSAGVRREDSAAFFGDIDDSATQSVFSFEIGYNF